MKSQAVLDRLDNLPLNFEESHGVIFDNRLMLVDTQATIVLRKQVIRRPIADIYKALNFDPWLNGSAVIDTEGHVRIGPFQVVYNRQSRYMYLTFARIQPMITMFFVELTQRPADIKVASA